MTAKITGGVKMPQYISPVRSQSGSITPAVDRIINVFPDENHDAFSEFTVNAVTCDLIPNLIPENIRKNVNILGCIGSYGGEYQEKTVTPSASQTVVTPDSNYYGLSKVTVRPAALAELTVIPGTSEKNVVPGTGFSGLAGVIVLAVTASMIEGLIPENIKEGVTILGVTGTLRDGGNKLDENGWTGTVNKINMRYLIKSIVLPSGITSVGKTAFFGCNHLESVVIPDTCTSVGVSAFQSCTMLKHVYMPDSVESIGAGAFRNCTYLEKIYIPAAVTTIGAYAFDNCRHFTDVYYGGTQAQWNNISIAGNNSYLLNAAKHFNSTGLPED